MGVESATHVLAFDDYGLSVYDLSNSYVTIRECVQLAAKRIE